jgi:uncharacterized delta-60 repeat protein
MTKRWFFTFSLASLLLAVAGCDESETTDAGTDAPAPIDAGRDTPAVDAPVTTDTPEVTDAGTDAGEMGDGGMPLPAITNPDPHTVAASAAGHDRFYGVAFADDSSFYVVGQTAASTTAPIDWQTVVGHFGADGELDTDFGTDGWFVTDLTEGTSELARGIALQSDGKIVIGATVDDEDATDLRDKDIAVFRLNTDGTLDSTFGDAGVRITDLSPGAVDGTNFRADAAYGLAIDAMDRIIISGELIAASPRVDADWAVVRYTANGALDTTFSTDGIFSLDIEESVARGRGVSVLEGPPGGLIVASGYYGSAPIEPILFALDANGALVTTFGEGGIYREAVLNRQAEIYGVAVVGTQLVTTGYGGTDSAEDADNDLVSLRINSNGTRDLTYGPDGANGVVQLRSFTFADNARALAALPGNRSVHVGATRSSATEADAVVWVLDADGALDTTFDTDGFATANTTPGTIDHFWAVAVDPRGERVVAVGIGGTSPATDDDGLIYLFETP